MTQKQLRAEIKSSEKTCLIWYDSFFLSCHWKQGLKFQSGGSFSPLKASEAVSLQDWKPKVSEEARRQDLQEGIGLFILQQTQCWLKILTDSIKESWSKHREAWFPNSVVQALFETLGGSLSVTWRQYFHLAVKPKDRTSHRADRPSLAITQNQSQSKSFSPVSYSCLAGLCQTNVVFPVAPPSWKQKRISSISGL